MIRGKAILIILFYFILHSGMHEIFAQNKELVDSLLIEWGTEKNVEIKINISEALFDELIKGDYKEAMDFAKFELSEYEALRSQKLIIYAYNHIASVYRELGNLDSADYYCNRALNICEQNDFEHEKQITNLNIGYNYFRRFHFEESLFYLFKTIDYFEKTNNNKNLAKVFNLIAWSYLRQSKFNKASEYLNKALELNKLSGDKYDAARTYTGFGILNYSEKKWEKAILFYKKAIEMGNGASNNNLDAVIYFQLSVVYQKLGDFEKAKQLLLKAIKRDKNSKNLKNIAYDYIVLGSLCIHTDSLVKAEFYTQIANEIANEINDIELIYYSFNNLAQISYENKDYKKAFDYHLMSKESDSLLTLSKTKDIAQIEMQYKLEKQQQQYEIIQQKRKYQNRFFIGVLILTLIILTLLYIIKIGKTKKQSLEKKLLQEKLEQKNKEITTSVMYRVKKNELLISIAKQLTKIKFDLTEKASKDRLNDIINEMQLNVNEDIWKEFEIRFQNVHNKFYDKLTTKYPDLTVNERRLSAFLKLNMTTKEISAITCQTVSAIEMARTRLRRKYNIHNCEISLVTFINQL